MCGFSRLVLRNEPAFDMLYLSRTRVLHVCDQRIHVRRIKLELGSSNLTKSVTFLHNAVTGFSPRLTFCCPKGDEKYPEGICEDQGEVKTLSFRVAGLNKAEVHDQLFY